ncbi:hypothetical protein SHKM778_45520 [Streptomyces sp. KM77-8]|uniref:GNAT family N-acetyltransferase n=1 Tax=Streptomyces haneummycinicus TaxID=3074435 RepID=A0AAT9HKW6_9ACTN
MEPSVSAVDLDIRRFGHQDLPQIRQTIIDLHADAAGPDRDDDFKKKFPGSWTIGAVTRTSPA